MKDKILKAFEDLGFKLDNKEEMGYSFNYEGLNFLYLYNDEDENFLNISLPGIVEVENDRMLQTCVLLEKMNSTLKYVKAYMIGNSVWLFYERELFDDEDLMIIIEHMILHLEAGIVFAQKMTAEMEETMASNFTNDNDDDALEDIIAEEIVEDDDNE